MPIRPPALDDRGFDDLVADMLQRVPAHTPEWTDVREGDPGRTLIDLFAWMGDTILYRANLIPERQRLAFLRLLGRPLRPAQSATGLVQIGIDDPKAGDAVVIPRHFAITKPVHFETDEELVVLPIEGHAYVKRLPTDDERESMAGLLSDLSDIYGLDRDAAAYVTTPVFTGASTAAGSVDTAAQTLDGCIWFAVLAPGPEPALKQQVKDALAGGASNRRVALSLGLAPDIEEMGGLSVASARAPIPHIWEISSSSGDGTDYFQLEVISDGSQGLTQEGVTRVLLPGGDDFGAPPNDVLDFVDAGVGDRPPRLDDPITAARLVTWIRLRPAPEARGTALRLKWAGVNCVPVTQLRTFGRRQIGNGTGLSGQSLSLGETQVEPSSLVLEVEQQEGMRVWRQVPDVALAGPGERVYSLDPEEGTVRFGDGVNGAAPAIGRAIHVASMRAGGGIQGNLPSGSLKSITAPTPSIRLKCVQALPTRFGGDAELIEHAERRIPAELRHAGRGVTRSDLINLALATPGQSIGRVEVLERFKPHQRRSGLPGVASVMVLPAIPGVTRPAPRPDRPMLEAVHRWLEPGRPIGTELYVIGPEYVPLGVSAAVELIDPSNRDQVLDNVRTAIRATLWALGPGGPDGSGWPLGKAIDDRLIEIAVARVPEVRTVAPVRLFRLSGSNAWLPVNEDSAGREILPLSRWQLPDLVGLAVGEGEMAATTLEPVQIEAVDGAVAVPVVPELC